jgi:BTB/POZ domain
MTTPAQEGTATSSGSSQTAEATAEVVEIGTGPLGIISRRGPDDKLIILNVGGTEFPTLRSTVNSNSVLATHVSQAEANKLLVGSTAVFIDRNPKHFGTILQFLRNRVEFKGKDVTSTNLIGALMPAQEQFAKAYFIDLPKDEKVARELFVEASYYNLTELQQALNSNSWMVGVASVVTGKSKNPFEAFNSVIGNARTALLTIGGIAGAATGATKMGSGDKSNSPISALLNVEAA